MSAVSISRRRSALAEPVAPPTDDLWRDFVDAAILLGGEEPRSGTAVPEAFLSLAEAAAEGVPACLCCEAVFSAAVASLYPDQRLIPTAGAGTQCPSPLYCCARARLLGIQAPFDWGTAEIAARTCIALHFGDHREAADGLVALGTSRPGADAGSSDYERFEEQAVNYLEVLDRAYPDPYVERMLAWRRGEYRFAS